MASYTKHIFICMRLGWEREKGEGKEDGIKGKLQERQRESVRLCRRKMPRTHLLHIG